MEVRGSSAVRSVTHAYGGRTDDLRSGQIRTVENPCFTVNPLGTEVLIFVFWIFVNRHHFDVKMTLSLIHI